MNKDHLCFPFVRILSAQACHTQQLTRNLRCSLSNSNEDTAKQAQGYTKSILTLAKTKIFKSVLKILFGELSKQNFS